MNYKELGQLFEGLRAVVTIADETGHIVFLNDLALEHYGDRGGVDLVGTHLDDCHNPTSQAEIGAMYARYRAGDFTPTRYHKEKEDGSLRGPGVGETIVLIPLVIDGCLRGVAELMWNERAELVIETPLGPDT